MLPLSDLRVLAIEQYGTGPYATMHLAELGADVIKIEHLAGGDIGRHVPPYRVTDNSLFFQFLNRSKRSVCLDVAKPDGRAVLEDLVRVSDGLFSNVRGDVPGKLGIRYDDLSHVNPQIVCCALTGYDMESRSAGIRLHGPGAGWMDVHHW